MYSVSTPNAAENKSSRKTFAVPITGGNPIPVSNADSMLTNEKKSSDGKYIYGKTMNDTITAFATGREAQKAAWKLHAGFGYEHAPSVLIEKDGDIFFCTRTGVVCALEGHEQKVAWAHKIDNSMVNTVNVLDKKNLLVSTMDGQVVLLHIKD